MQKKDRNSLITFFVLIIIGVLVGPAVCPAAYLGGQDDYEAYKKRTPLLIPRL